MTENDLTILSKVKEWMALVGKTNDLIWLTVQRSALGAALDVSSVVEIEDKHFLPSFANKIEVVILAIDAFAIGKVFLGRSLAFRHILRPAKFAFRGVDNQICHGPRCSKNGGIILVLNRQTRLWCEAAQLTVLFIWGKH